MFDDKQIGVSTSGPRGAFNQWHYATSVDNRSVVGGVGYFIHSSLEVGDHITANCANGTICLRVTAIDDAYAATTTKLWEAT